MRKARKKPIEIKYTTYDELTTFYDIAIQSRLSEVKIADNKITRIVNMNDKEKSWKYIIPTIEGTMNMTNEDVLIIGVRNEIYPCKIDIFEETYEIIK